nr:hypothetical protein [Caldicellulosiruptor acetigenus]
MCLLYNFSIEIINFSNKKNFGGCAFALIIDGYSKAKLKITQKLNKLFAMLSSALI